VATDWSAWAPKTVRWKKSEPSTTWQAKRWTWWSWWLRWTTGLIAKWPSTSRIHLSRATRRRPGIRRRPGRTATPPPARRYVSTLSSVSRNRTFESSLSTIQQSFRRNAYVRVLKVQFGKVMRPRWALPKQLFDRPRDCWVTSWRIGGQKKNVLNCILRSINVRRQSYGSDFEILMQYNRRRRSFSNISRSRVTIYIRIFDCRAAAKAEDGNSHKRLQFDFWPFFVSWPARILNRYYCT